MKSLWAGEKGLDRIMHKASKQKPSAESYQTPEKAALKLSCLALPQVSETQENLQHQEYLGVAVGHIPY